MVYHQQKKMRNKNIHILLFLSVLTFTGSLHLNYIGTGIRADVFLFYDYVTPSGKNGRLVTNIIYELNYMISIFSILVLWSFYSDKKTIKNILFPFVWVSGIDIMDYFLWYKQGHSVYKLIILLVLILIYNREWIYRTAWKNK